MNDLGDILSALTAGLIRARQSADEQTAALAELYRDNPLLSGLSVPRIRIPELTVDLPLIIENHSEGEAGQLNDPDKITKSTLERVKTTLATNNIRLSATFLKSFQTATQAKLADLQKSNSSVSQELVSRTVQDVFVDTLRQTGTTLSVQEREALVRDIRAGAGLSAVAKPAVPSFLMTNVRTADVKDKTSEASVVRLKITFREEGVEWVTQSSETGGVVRTLAPE